jgi:hypothetical protein
LRIDAGRVFGASARIQPATEAPASVSFVTAEDIARYGYRTLADILRDPAYIAEIRKVNLAAGFAGADDYYTRSSSIRFLDKITTPALCLSAEDDPFLPRGVLPTASERITAWRAAHRDRRAPVSSAPPAPAPPAPVPPAPAPDEGFVP